MCTGKASVASKAAEQNSVEKFPFILKYVWDVRVTNTKVVKGEVVTTSGI